ncbi:MAG: indolepyruvate ferredoxin oxidoreductase family protein, partial [Hyphomonadaceae bacterium]
MSSTSVTLDDKYTLETGRVYLTGIQALVRLPLIQRKRDLANGLTTGGFISGYRGSPLGGYDQALNNARRFLAAQNIHFQPGVNEDLAATSVWGSQQIGLTPNPNVDGVFGVWYGKGPGVDRAMDVFKHANSAGTSPTGGVLALLGDDHGCQSSTLAHQSEQVIAAAMMPILNPASVQEYIDFGIYGFALSRYTGCWVGFKAVTEIVESSASVSVHPGRLSFVTPTDFEMPPGGLGIRWPDRPLDQEARLHGPKMAAIAAFARANPIDRTVWDSPDARIGILTTGKAYQDTLQALEDLGINAARAKEMGLRVYKVGLTWPLEVEGARRFAQGLEEVIVVEEKRGFIEDQFIKILYNEPKRPVVIGKTYEDGRLLFPSAGELDPGQIAQALGERMLARFGENQQLRQRLAWLQDKLGAQSTPASSVARTPFFCSGCPHNTSTRVPEGSRAMGGIGCHGMVLQIPERRTSLITHMGGEGATWIGQAPFTDEQH